MRDFLAQWEDRPGAYVKQDEAESFTHSELNQLARTNAGKLAGWNLRGENVALLANNSADWIVSYWSLVFAGATVVPLSPGFTERELLTLMKLCDCRWIVCDQKNEKSARKLSQNIHIGQLTISNGDFNIATAPKSFVERTRPTPAPVLCVTSGSTGTAKAVMLSDENLEANTQSHIESLSLSSRDIVLITLPLHYSYAHTAQFLSHTRLGGTIVLYDRPIFSPRRFCQLIERHGVTITSVVPTLVQILNNYRYLEEHDLSSLRYLCCGGAPLETTAVRSLMARLPHTRFVHTYGLTEASPRVTTLPPETGLSRLPSIGKPVPGVEVRIVAENGEPAANGEVGELQVRGKNVMAGYYGSPGETHAVVNDGWLSTGDLARLDNEGYIYLAGRKKNIIISDGINVHPEEIESVLLEHPSVSDAVIRGEYTADAGEVIAAHVATRNGDALSLQHLHEFMRGKLAEWKWPRRLYLHPAMTRTETGKIRRCDVQ